MQNIGIASVGLSNSGMFAFDIKKRDKPVLETTKYKKGLTGPCVSVRPPFNE